MTVNNISIPEDKLREICKRFLIHELALFGSALRDDFNDKSDIDLLVEFIPESGISLFDIIDIQEEFKKLFGREVDIVSKNAIKRSKNDIRKNMILNNHKVIYTS
ncbi:MAG: nucleotidyltransferase domain-containing protein [Ignavibacterium sp.]|jgi:predicted nucleotidyltransferase|nr:nucleotidyltransferase domain-containing protein [Ignavibacterium sp.]